MRRLTCLLAVALVAGCQRPSNKEPAPAVAAPTAPAALTDPVAPAQDAISPATTAPATRLEPVAPAQPAGPTVAEAEAVLKKCLDSWAAGHDPTTFNARHPEIDRRGGGWDSPWDQKLSRYNIKSGAKRSDKYQFTVAVEGKDRAGNRLDSTTVYTLYVENGKWIVTQ